MCKCSGKCGCNITSTTKGEKGDASPEATLGYKVYKALITQASTGAPTVKILENTIGIIVWTRGSIGEYVGTLASAFTADKTYFTVGQNLAASSTDTITEYVVNPANTVLITTYSSGVVADDLLTDAPLLIEVYP